MTISSVVFSHLYFDTQKDRHERSISFTCRTSRWKSIKAIHAVTVTVQLC